MPGLRTSHSHHPADCFYAPSMAPAVPFALLGVVQLASVAGWLGFAAAACFPGMIRRATPIAVIGALAVAAADALTALHLDVSTSDGIALLRLGGLVLLALGLADGAMRASSGVVASITAPLGARPSIALAGGAAGVVAALAAWVRGSRPGYDRRVAGTIAGALVMTAAAAALADPSRTSTQAALAQLSARAAAIALLIAAIALLARGSLLGKVVGAIVAGVVAMAVGAVAVVGIGVANEVQHDQSQRLLSVATAQQKSLQSIATRAGLFAQVVAAFCPNRPTNCAGFLRVFSDDPGYFAVYDGRRGAAVIAPTRTALDNTALLELAGSPVVRAALRRSATAQTVPSGPVLLHGAPSRLAIVAAAPGRPAGAAGNAQVRPTFAVVYGVTLINAYLHTVSADVGYDVSILADGRVLSSSLPAGKWGQLLQAAGSGGLADVGPATSTVVAAQGTSPTVAFVPITAAGNDNVRVATLAISQPASVALSAQRSVLRRLVLTALGVLVVVALFAFAMAQRIADPVRRLTLAAGRVRRGDLDSTVAVESSDEVGALARAFDAMTTSLRTLTTDLRDAADQEARLRARLETVVGSMTDGLVTTDGTGHVAGANPMALQLLGAAEADVVGGRLIDVVDVRSSDGEKVLARRTSVAATDAVLHRTDGDQVPVRISRAPLADQPGEVVVLSDRTREHELERLKTEFLANVSHELRTPLTPIRGYAEMLFRRPNLPAEQSQGFLQEILAGTAKMSRAVELLVDVAALDAGQVVPQRREVKVAAIVDERIAAWKERYPQRASDLRRRVAAKLPALEVDTGWLAKALDELADNAVKYTSAGTSITLAATLTDDNEVSLAVRDAGEGIDTERLAELLGDFSQADSSETRRVGGFGLGLGFVSRVAAALNARLQVSSEVGKGAEFALLLAALTAPNRRRAPARSSRR